MDWMKLLDIAPNAAVAIAAIWLMVQFRKELALNRKEIMNLFGTFLEQASADRADFINIARVNGEHIARLEERTRQPTKH